MNITNERIAEEVMRFGKWNQIGDKVYWLDATTIMPGDPFVTPNFLTDHNAAMMVVEKMREKGFLYFGDNDCELGYDVQFVGDDVEEDSQHKSLCHAICEAALKALGKE